MSITVAEKRIMPMHTPAGDTGQATMVEQSRAIAEVQAAVLVAANRPRDKNAAIREMREVCGIQSLAERAFFRFSRGGQQITGETVHLARELARCWGNIDYGVKEMARDDARGQSEMFAFAWDLQTNARAGTIFIVPHKRDKKGGPEMLIDMRDIYENNANNSARRLREMIFSILPVWFREEAADICRATLENGGNKPLVQRAADCLAAFETIGITRAQVEIKIGRASAVWTAEDVAVLGVVFKSIKRGETTKELEFPKSEPETKPANKLDALERSIHGAPASQDAGGSEVSDEGAGGEP